MVIAKDVHERKMSIPAGVGREGFIIEEGFKCTLEICLLWQNKGHLKQVKESVA